MIDRALLGCWWLVDDAETSREPDNEPQAGQTGDAKGWHREQSAVQMEFLDARPESSLISACMAVAFSERLALDSASRGWHEISHYESFRSTRFYLDQRED